MPIYEYKCQKCGQQREVWQKFSDLPVSNCEACSGKMKKLISQSSFHLKGSGWYVTDYAAKSAGSTPVEGSSENREAPSASAESAVKAEAKTSSESSNTKDS